ncbi:MAG TPA: membrane dipeptidase [Rhodanobacteraceae bacterium]|nr:membrane dipeptidase [Rhodanobacteraceae bacterium]
MTNRREFLAISTLAAAAATGGLGAASAKASPHWKPYRDTIAIDGEGGFSLFFLDDVKDPAIAKEIAAAHACGLSGVLFSVAPSGRFWMDDAAFHRTQDFIAKCKAKIDAHADTFMQILTAADLERARREKRVGLVFRFQGAEPLGEDSDRIPMFREHGVRVIQLTHNRRNLVGDGCTEPSQAGLSKFGYEVVERLNAEKIVVDLAHGAPQTIADGIRASKTPALISHTGCRALSDLPRCTSDANLRALADKGGVAGVIFWPYLRTDTQPMAIDVIRHVEHMIDVCGEDHVGLGTDGQVPPIERTPAFEKDNLEFIKGAKEDGIFDKSRPDELYTFIPDLNMANRFEVLATMLSARKHSDARIAKILGGNFARVLGEVWG